MKRQQPVKQSIRVFVRDVAGNSAAKQERRAESDGVPVVYQAHQRDAWLRSLQSGQLGWVWKLSLLAVPGGGDIRPAADFAGVIAEICRRIGHGARVIEGESGANSGIVGSNTENADWQRFLARIEDAGGKIAAGRHMTTREARKRGAGGAAISTERSAANLLKTTHAGKLEMIIAYWQSSAYPTREARALAINAELEAAGLAPLGQWITIWRALRKIKAI